MLLLSWQILYAAENLKIQGDSNAIVWTKICYYKLKSAFHFIIFSWRFVTLIEFKYIERISRFKPVDFRLIDNQNVLFKVIYSINHLRE